MIMGGSEGSHVVFILQLALLCVVVSFGRKRSVARWRVAILRCVFPESRRSGAGYTLVLGVPGVRRVAIPKCCGIRCPSCTIVHDLVHGIAGSSCKGVLREDVL